MLLESRATNTHTGGRKMTVMNGSLWKRVSELGGFSASLLYLAEAGSGRLTLQQAAFFLLAATADAAGSPATRSQLMEAHEGSLRSALRNSYRQLLEPSRVHPNALGWLTTEENPLDAREQLLKLTDKGKAVIDAALVALEPLKKVPKQ